MCSPAHIALAAQPDAQNVTQLAPRYGTEERPRNVNTYLTGFPSRRTPSTSGPSPDFANPPYNLPRVRASSSGVRTNSTSFGSLPSTSKSAARRKTSCNIFAIRNVSRSTARPGFTCTWCHADEAQEGKVDDLWAGRVVSDVTSSTRCEVAARLATLERRPSALGYGTARAWNELRRRSGVRHNQGWGTRHVGCARR